VTFTQASSASIEAEQQRGAEVDFLFGEGENPRRRQELVNKTYPTMRTQQQKLSNFIIFL